MSNLIGVSIGRYHILEQLGQGGMATVYKAYDTNLERDVAVKFIRSDQFGSAHLEMMLKRFEREAKSLAKLSHPNILKVLDYGEHENSPFLVMEYLPGGTLKERLGKPTPWQEAVRLLIPIAQALEYAHDHNLIHRDIKPANILLTEKGQPMLTDFGIAKILESEDTGGLTGTGVGIGTPEYMAPEQWAGQATKQSDIYSLGVVLYELVTGRKPYAADTPVAVLLKQANDPLPRPTQYTPDLPEAVERILIKALAKNTEDRYPSAAEFTDALEQLVYQSGMSLSSSQPAVVTPPAPWQESIVKPQDRTVDEIHTGPVAIPQDRTVDEVHTASVAKPQDRTVDAIHTASVAVPQNRTVDETPRVPAVKPVQSPGRKKSGWVWGIGAIGVICLLIAGISAVLWGSNMSIPKVTETRAPTTSIPAFTSTATAQSENSIATFIAQTFEARQPTATVAIEPTTAPPTAQSTPIPFTPSQWNGKFRWFGSLNPVTFIIQEVNGSSFTGAMYWTFSTCRVTERTQGDIYYDITTAPEQNRWALHPDFQSGDKSGTWLRWTQNESIGATRCYLTISGDWWYAHIKNGHMIGIHFTNSTNTVPDKDATFDFTLTSQ
jgi:serine/threonine protein kinase